MRLSSRKANREKRMELNMTSMIDVVFLLLIFFMTTVSFVKTERELDPAIQVEETSSTSKIDYEPAVVELVDSGLGFVYRIGSRQMASPEELSDVLRQFPNKEDGAFVRVHDYAPFQMAAAAVQACKSAGFLSVSYVPSTSID